MRAPATIGSLLMVLILSLEIIAAQQLDDTTPTVLPVAVTNGVVMWGAYFFALVLGLLALVYTLPRWFIRLIVWNSHPSVLWRVETSSHICSLTIDDAPSDNTAQILDILLAHNIKATFFIISSHIAGREDVMRRIVREGHVLGNHLTEDRASILDDLHVFEQKLLECDTAISRFQQELPSTGTTEGDNNNDEDDANVYLLGGRSAKGMKWLRPASGWFTTSMRQIVERNGYRICMGSVYPHDAQIHSEVLNSFYLRSLTRNGSVIIVHDRPWTIGVLKRALPKLVKDFKFVSLEELTFHQNQS